MLPDVDPCTATNCNACDYGSSISCASCSSGVYTRQLLVPNAHNYTCGTPFGFEHLVVMSAQAPYSGLHVPAIRSNPNYFLVSLQIFDVKISLVFEISHHSIARVFFVLFLFFPLTSVPALSRFQLRHLRSWLQQLVRCLSEWLHAHLGFRPVPMCWYDYVV
jgi:hypothetical protein